VRRHKSCRIRFRALDWKDAEMEFEDDLSELLQHECDHLDGILAVSRAIDARSFCLRSERAYIS
jgi:peptide deformylase